MNMYMIIFLGIVFLGGCSGYALTKKYHKNYEKDFGLMVVGNACAIFASTLGNLLYAYVVVLGSVTLAMINERVFPKIFSWTIIVLLAAEITVAKRGYKRFEKDCINPCKTKDYLKFSKKVNNSKAAKNIKKFIGIVIVLAATMKSEEILAFWNEWYYMLLATFLPAVLAVSTKARTVLGNYAKEKLEKLSIEK